MSQHNLCYFDGYTLIKGEILRKGEEIIKMPPKELQLLTLLVENAGKVVTKEQIIKDVWSGGEVSDESLTRCICSLRKRLGETKNNVCIMTLYGKGYIFSKKCLYSNEDVYTSGDYVPPLSTGARKETASTRRIKKVTYIHNYKNGMKSSLASVEQALRYFLCSPKMHFEHACHDVQSRIEKVLLTDPFNAQGLAIMGLLKTLKGDEMTGRLNLSQARQLKPENSDIDFYYAWHLTVRGEVDSARTVLDKLIANRYVKFDTQVLKEMIEKYDIFHERNKSRRFNFCTIKKITGTAS